MKKHSTDMWVVGAAVMGLGVLVGGCDQAPADETATEISSQALHQGSDRRGRENDCQRPPTDVPAALAVPTDECLKVQALGIGVQVYACTAGAWVLKAPEANLVDDRGRYLGNHFLGPTWQWRDGSKVKGARVAQVAAPAATDIPWLLLSVPSGDGDGELAGVKHILRLHTVGGVAPAGACTDGAESRVPYTADYLFYHPRRCPIE